MAKQFRKKNIVQLCSQHSSCEWHRIVSSWGHLYVPYQSLGWAFRWTHYNKRWLNMPLNYKQDSNHVAQSQLRVWSRYKHRPNTTHKKFMRARFSEKLAVNIKSIEIRKSISRQTRGDVLILSKFHSYHYLKFNYEYYERISWGRLVFKPLPGIHILNDFTECKSQICTMTIIMSVNDNEV